MERMGAMKGQVQSAAVQMKLSNTQQNMVDSLADASKAMGNMNATMDPAKMAKTMNEFQIQNEKMDLKQVGPLAHGPEASLDRYIPLSAGLKRCTYAQEMMDDALDNLFDDDDIEGEADAVTQQVSNAGMRANSTCMHMQTTPTTRAGVGRDRRRSIESNGCCIVGGLETGTVYVDMPL